MSDMMSQIFGQTKGKKSQLQNLSFSLKKEGVTGKTNSLQNGKWIVDGKSSRKMLKNIGF